MANDFKPTNNNILLDNLCILIFNATLYTMCNKVVLVERAENATFRQVITANDLIMKNLQWKIVYGY